ncbi:MAG: YdcF family protein [Actinobacteria bacterium]|nr:YdcF family protein [Actinomycetota bacterium]
MKMNSDDIFFYSAKILGYFLRIDNLLFIAVAVTIALFWTRRTKLAKRLTVVIAISLFIFSNVGLGFAALRTLENRYPIPAISCDDGYEGVIVLGGGINPGLIAQERNQPQLNDAGDRTTKALELLNKCSGFKVLYSTFSGSLNPEGMSESDSARLFFKEQGIADSRTIFENESRNTFENAKFSAKFAKPGKKWILVTSASHMPRAMTTFERFDWNVTAYPVDFRAESRGNYLSWSRGQGIENWNMFIHEWIGSLFYRLRLR